MLPCLKYTYLIDSLRQLCVVFLFHRKMLIHQKRFKKLILTYNQHLAQCIRESRFYHIRLQSQIAE